MTKNKSKTHLQVTTLKFGMNLQSRLLDLHGELLSKGHHRTRIHGALNIRFPVLCEASLRRSQHGDIVTHRWHETPMAGVSAKSLFYVRSWIKLHLKKKP